MQLADTSSASPVPEASARPPPCACRDRGIQRLTLPQERYNADWVREQGLGLCAAQLPRHRPRRGRLLSPDRFAAFRTAAARQNNRAVFEIPGILERILRQSEAALP